MNTNESKNENPTDANNVLATGKKKTKKYLKTYYIKGTNIPAYTKMVALTTAYA